MTVIAEVVDPDRRRVELTAERWGHIIRSDGHPELGHHQADVLRCVRSPDRRLAGRRPGEEWFYAAGRGPSRWLKVVVRYEQDRGAILTCFPRRSYP